MIQVTQQIRSGWCVVYVKGRADGECADAFETVLRAAVEAHLKVVADFRDLEYISSAGIRAVLQAARAAQGRHIEFAVCSLGPKIQKVFDMSGLHHVLRIHGELPC